MPTPKFGSEQRKKFIKSLIPNKRIMFVDVEYGEAKIREPNNCKDCDLIIGYYKAKSIYIICNPVYHIGRETIDFSRLTEKFKGRDIIKVEHKRAPTTPMTYEPVIIVTENNIEKFSSNLSDYIDILEKRKRKVTKQ